jgi:type II secretory pathway pseudopilin PulG
MPGSKIDGRTYGFLILAVVIAMAASSLVAQTGVSSQADVASATREVAAATREVANSNRQIAESIRTLADAVRQAGRNQGATTAAAAGAGEASILLGSEVPPASNQGIDFE